MLSKHEDSLQKFASRKIEGFRSSGLEGSVNYAIETYVTLEKQRCCVTLATVDNMLIMLCTGIISIQEMFSSFTNC